MNKVLFILILALINNSLNAGCIDIRLDELGGSVSKIPIYDQDEFGSCFAYAAAQMIDAYRFSHNYPNQNQLTSPIKISADFAYEKSPDYYTTKPGGDIEHAIEIAIRNGSCDKKITDQLLSKTNEKKLYNDLIFQLNNYVKEKEELSSINKLMNFILNKPSLSLLNIECNLKNSGLPKNIVPNIENLEKIIKESYNWHNTYIKKLFSEICSKNNLNISKMPEPITEYIANKPWGAQERSDRTNEVIKRLLGAKNPQPIGLSFCGATISNKNYKGNSSEYNNEACLPHAALIVGSKKTKSGSCMYLLRNAFGTGCESPRKIGHECIEGTGQIWVPEERIGKATLGLSVYR